MALYGSVEKPIGIWGSFIKMSESLIYGREITNEIRHEKKLSKLRNDFDKSLDEKDESFHEWLERKGIEISEYTP